MENKRISSKECILCHHDQLAYLTKVRDGDQLVYRCLNCGHVQICPVPQDEEYDAFYQTNEMGRVTVPKSLLDDEELCQKNKIWVDKQVEKAKTIIPKAKSIFEIGSGYGWFLKGMRDDGYVADGLELSYDKCISAKQRLNIDIYNIKFPLCSDPLPKELLHAYDVVCLYHVLEHVPNPVNFLAETKQFLRKDGQVLVEVPNYDDYMKKICTEYDSFSYLKAHLSYFSPDSLLKVFQAAGFGTVKIYGDQKYGIFNALRWLKEKKPNLVKYEFDSPAGLEWVDEYYKSELENTLKSYTIFALGTI
jgi:SAM-dependent methyltransferase